MRFSALWVQIREHPPGEGRPSEDCGMTLLLLPSQQGWRSWPSAPRAQPSTHTAETGCRMSSLGPLQLRGRLACRGRTCGEGGGAFTGHSWGVHVRLRSRAGISAALGWVLL